jgi:transcription antitermination factor NusG
MQTLAFLVNTSSKEETLIKLTSSSVNASSSLDKSTIFSILIFQEKKIKIRKREKRERKERKEGKELCTALSLV